MATSSNNPQRFRATYATGSNKLPNEIKTCAFLKNPRLPSPRIIVSGTYLPDGRAAFIDRNNNQLLIADAEKETYDSIPLEMPVNGGDRYDPSHDKPSAVSRGFTQNQLLVTFTRKDSSTVVLYELSKRLLLSVKWKVNIPSRTRSAVVVDDSHIAVTSPEDVHVLDRNGVTRDSKKRRKRDRGGLMMADRRDARFFYGDGDEFVCCQWKNGMIREIFRFQSPQMKFPRGSALDAGQRILVCCDTSRNVFQVDSTGGTGNIVVQGAGKAYGDVDFLDARMEFFTTFWSENEWPIIFRF